MRKTTQIKHALRRDVILDQMLAEPPPVIPMSELFPHLGEATPAHTIKLEALTPADAPKNPLRPTTLDGMVGQETLKPLIRQLVNAAKATHQALDPILFVGSAGTGKTTLATVLAHELNTRIFILKAPTGIETLQALCETARDGDVVFIDEIHMIYSGDRRGITQAADPENYYSLLEDGILMLPTGPVQFPRVTWLGATTDVGLLPEPLTMRFAIQPRLAPYTEADLTKIANLSAQALGLALQEGVAAMFAKAARGTPRVVNSYLRSARMLTGTAPVTVTLARQVVEDLNGTTLDGLTASMQIVLRFLYEHCRRETKTGPVYTASVNSLATAAGHGRDTKAISLLVEPTLFQRGYLELRPSGRTLTTAGVDRAKELCRAAA